MYHAMVMVLARRRMELVVCVRNNMEAMSGSWVGGASR